MKGVIFLTHPVDTRISISVILATPHNRYDRCIHEITTMIIIL